MKPMNFPARKDARRSSALARVMKTGASGKLTAEQSNDLANRIALKLNSQARDIRTKKVRGAGR